MPLHAKLSVLASAGMTILLASAAPAQTCGTVITSSVVLHANIGPCPGTALTVPDGVRNITINLNGFTITGSKTGGSAGIHVRGLMVVITGPGTIADFETGVLLQRYSAQKLTAQDLRLKGNRWGVNLLSAPAAAAGDSRILGNRIDGPGEVGIRADAALFAQIAENRVTGQSQAGIALYNAEKAVVERNTVRENKAGIYVNGFSPPVLIRQNDVSDNETDGISCISQATIADNVVTRNGRDGIAVAGMWPNTVELNTLITGNFVIHNGRRGIAVGNVDPSPAELVGHSGGGTIRVTGNFAWLNREFDLFWDGSGPSNCWSGNKQAKSTPPTLPACQ